MLAQAKAPSLLLLLQDDAQQPGNRGGTAQEPRFSLLDGGYHAGPPTESADDGASDALAVRPESALQLHGEHGHALQPLRPQMQPTSGVGEPFPCAASLPLTPDGLPPCVLLEEAERARGNTQIQPTSHIQSKALTSKQQSH